MTSDAENKALSFRRLHDAGTFVVPNPWNRGTAQILESLGFQALATTSAGLAFAKGLRDGAASVTRDATLQHVREIAEATKLPVTADLENGFGDDGDAVAETIRRAGELGIAGGSIEDASYDTSEPLYEFTLAVERITAAVEAARGLAYPFVLTARSEGFIRGHPDLEETIRRLVAFEEAGADVLYAPGLPDLGSIRQVCESVTRPVNFVVGVSASHFSLRELQDAGVRRISTGSSFVRASLASLVQASREVLEQGTFTFCNGLPSVGDWNQSFQ